MLSRSYKDRGSKGTMKQQITKRLRPGMTSANRLTGILALALLFAVSGLAQTDAVLPPLGGTGGKQFVARCQEGRHLTGFELLVGLDIDA
ncbi:MAG TPA: hypothetical protein VMS31_17445, partial [Pyrinomonadaceae bacterium]|nr:hypothetical protein [Pyrinomonadaceae bacterium]